MILTLPAIQTGAAENMMSLLPHQQEVREVVDVLESPPAIDPAQVADQEQLTGLLTLSTSRILTPATTATR